MSKLLIILCLFILCSCESDCKYERNLRICEYETEICIAEKTTNLLPIWNGKFFSIIPVNNYINEVCTTREKQ